MKRTATQEENDLISALWNILYTSRDVESRRKAYAAIDKAVTTIETWHPEHPPESVLRKAL